MVYRIRHSRSVQSNPDERRRRMEDRVQDAIGTFRVPDYAIRAYERPSYFLGIHQ
jgi:hypothetical protein